MIPTESTFTDAPAKVGFFKLRPFSLGSLNLCRRLNLSMLTGEASPDDLSEEEKQNQIVAFVFIQSQPLPVVLDAARDLARFSDKVLEFSMGLPVSAIGEAVAEIQRIMDAVGAANVEVMAKPGETAEDAPPN